MSARDAIHARLSGSSFRAEVVTDLLDAYRDEIRREAAVTVRAAAPKYLDNEVDQAIFWALDRVAAEIEPNKEAGQ